MEDQSVDGRIILDCILQKESGKVWTGFLCLRVDTCSRLLRIP